MFKPMLRRFTKDQTGALSVETIIIFPILLWALGATFVFWDAFKTQNINLKATYTVADLISREVDPITPTYIDGMNDMFRFLTSGDNGNELRVTVVKMGLAADGVTPEYELVWSHSTDAGMPVITEIKTVEDKLPMLAVGSQLIIVESQMLWEPIFGVGLDAITMKRFVFASPRFVPQVKFST